MKIQRNEKEALEQPQLGDVDDNYGAVDKTDETK